MHVGFHCVGDAGIDPWTFAEYALIVRAANHNETYKKPLNPLFDS